MSALADTHDLCRAGYLHAAMGLPLLPGAPEDFVRGFHNFRHADGTAIDAIAEEATQEVRRQLYADGVLPDRRKPDVAGRWAAAIWLAAAFAAGLGFENLVAGLRALGVSP